MVANIIYICHVWQAMLSAHEAVGNNTLFEVSCRSSDEMTSIITVLSLIDLVCKL